MFIVDENRPAKVEDDLRANLITVKVYSSQIKDEYIEHLDQFAKQLTEHIALAYCYVIVTFYTSKIDDVFDCFIKNGLNLVYDKIPIMQLWHLNQE